MSLRSSVLNSSVPRVPALLLGLAMITPGYCVAQATNQSTLYMSCGYVAGDAAYFNSIFAVNQADIGHAEQAFRSYAQTQTGNSATRALCRVSRDQNALNATRNLDRQAVGSRPGLPNKSVDISWRYVPSQTSTNIQNANLSRSVNTATPENLTTYNSANQNRQAASRTNQSQVVNNGGNTAPPVGSSSDSLVSGSSLGQTGQSMKDSVMSTETSLAQTGSQTILETTASLQKSAADRITGLFNKKKNKTDPAQQAATPATESASLAQNTVPPTPLATSAPQTVTPNLQQDSPSFASCHVNAGGSEYFSDVFPVMEKDDTKIRYAFWQQVGQQYKAGSVPFNTVSCSHSATEQEASASLTRNLSAAAQKGTPDNRIIKTGWSYMGR